MNPNYILSFTPLNVEGLAGNSNKDKKPYTTLSYANGPGYATAFNNDGERPNLTDVDTSKYSIFDLIYLL